MDLETIRALYRYNNWANDQSLEAVSRLAEADFIRHLKGGRSSVRDVLTHIVWSEWIWLQRWKGVTDLVFQPADFADVPPELVFTSDDLPTLESMRERFQAVASEECSFVQELKPEQLPLIVELRTVTGDPWRRPLWRLLVHAVNHSTYHRGQVAMMLRALGVTPLSTDFVGFEE